MIGLLLFDALALLYGGAYVLHSMRKHHFWSAAVTGLLGVALVGMCAVLLWVRERA